MGRASKLQRARRSLQARIDALEFHRAIDVPGRLRAAQSLAMEAEDLAAPDLLMQARLVEADMLQRSGGVVEGAKLVQGVLEWAEQFGSRSLLARSHLVLSSLLDGIGDAPASLEHALMAVELIDESTPPRARGNFLLRLADSEAADGSPDAARERYREALGIFEEIGDLERRLNVLNNLAYSEYEAGNLAEARRVAETMRLESESAGLALNPEFADTLARTLLAVGDHARAEATLRPAIADLAAGGDVQGATPAELLLTLAEVQRREGRLADARASLERCKRICEERELAAVEADAMAEEAEVSAAEGRFELAYELHKRFHARVMALASRRREAAARTREVLYEAAEARREAEHNWHLARTDPLTGLPNRRFVYEELPKRLAGLGRTPCVVAIVDADHFKRVNDTLSHELGDRAIYALASVLAATLRKAIPPDAAEAAFVARLGGEEFVVLVPERRHAPALAILEAMRAAVEAYPWGRLIGDLRLTVSIGATWAAAAEPPDEALRRADGNLYVAKRAGRNQVHLDPALDSAA